MPTSGWCRWMCAASPPCTTRRCGRAPPTSSRKEHGMCLRAGQRAPDFLRPDIGGKSIRPSDYRGRYLLLSFYRYASCPFCNLRVHELLQRLAEFDQHELSLVAVFQSARAGILEHVGKQQPPFPIIPDPAHDLYRRYGVETSLPALLLGLTRSEE